MTLIQQVTIYKSDTTTIDDAVVPISANLTSAQATCSTDPTHARPHLMLSEEGADKSTNLLQGTVAIASKTIRIQDTRRLTGQNTGWLTQKLANAGGNSALIGQRIVEQTWDIFAGAFIVTHDALIQDIQLEANKTVYKITTRDIRERERSLILFNKAVETVIWPSYDPEKNYVDGVGTTTGYGRTNPISGTSRLLIPPSKGVAGTFYKIAEDTQAKAGKIVFTEQPWIKGMPGTDWFDRILSYNVYGHDPALVGTGVTTLGSKLNGNTLTGLLVEWRAAGSSGVWKRLSNMPGYDNVPWAGAPGGIGSGISNGKQIFAPGFYSEESRFSGFYPNNVTSRDHKLQGVRISSTNSADIPTDGQSIEVRVLSGLPPSEKAPLFLELNAGQFLKNVYDGVYSASTTDVRYDSTVVNALIAKTPLLRAIITEPIQDGKSWLEENWYKIYGYIPRVNKNGEISPYAWEMPDAGVTVVTLNDANVEDASWMHGSGDAVTKIHFTYFRDYLNEDKQFSTVEVTVDEIFAAGVTLIGDKAISYAPVTVRDVSTLPNGAYGLAISSAELGWQLFQARKNAVKDRFVLGGQHISLTAMRSDAAVQGLQEGDWCVVSLTWLPDYATGLRGLNRLAQVISIQDKDPVLRHLELVDAGTNASVLAAPTISSVTVVGDGRVTVAVTGVPTGADVRLDYAVAASRPSQTSGDWGFLGRQTGSGSVTSRALPGGVIWIRARAEQMAKRPSAWDNAASVTNTQLYAITGAKLTMEGTGVPVLTWTPGSGTETNRIYAQRQPPGTAFTDPLPFFVDVLSSVGRYAFAELEQGHELRANVEAWSGNTAGVASGTQGLRTTVNSLVRDYEPIDILPPRVVVRELISSRTQTIGYVIIGGTLGQGSEAPLEWRYNSNGGAFTAWSTVDLSTVVLEVTRDPFYDIEIIAEVRQPDGRTASDVCMVPGRLEPFNPTTGKHKRIVPFDEGDYATRATDTTGVSLYTGVKDTRNVLVNTLFRYGTDTISGVVGGGTYAGHLLPATDALYTLGSSIKRWTTGSFSSDVTAGDFVLGAGSGGSASSGNPIVVYDEGVSLTTAVGSLNFTGLGVTATNVGAAVTVNITGNVTSVFGRTGAIVKVAGDYNFADLGAKPTTIAGFGITDFNSLGDARWLQLTGGTLSGTLSGIATAGYAFKWGGSGINQWGWYADNGGAYLRDVTNSHRLLIGAFNDGTGSLYGPWTVTNGLTVSAGTTAVQALTATTATVANTFVVTAGYSTLTGLRISGADVSNTIYNANANIGIVSDTGRSIFIGQVGTATGLTVTTTSGLVTASNGLTVSAGTTAVQALSVTGALNLNRSVTVSGINWYSSSYTAWQDYMGPAGIGQGIGTALTAPSGTYVTSWALRSFIENQTGYGWTWESGTGSATSPGIVAELSSATGNFRTIGSLLPDGSVYGQNHFASATSYIGWVGRSLMRSPSNGTINFYNNTETAYSDIQAQNITGAAIVRSLDTYGWAMGQINSVARIRYGASAADSFDLLAAGNGYAHLYLYHLYVQGSVDMGASGAFFRGNATYGFRFNDATNAYNAAILTDYGDFRARAQVRAAGWYGSEAGSSLTGLAAEMGVSGGVGNFITYNRTTSAWAPTVLGGSTAAMYSNAYNTYLRTTSTEGLTSSSSAGTTGSFRLSAGDGGTVKVYLYWNAAGAGLLNQSGYWGVRMNVNASGGALSGAWKIDDDTGTGSLSLNDRILYFRNGDANHKIYWESGSERTVWSSYGGQQLSNSQVGNITAFFGPSDITLYRTVYANYNVLINQTNKGYGLVGVYDATKYRAIYAMGSSYQMDADGNGLASMFGLAFAYDYTTGTGIKNITGKSLGHGMLVAVNGYARFYAGDFGTWTGGKSYATDFELI